MLRVTTSEADAGSFDTLLEIRPRICLFGVIRGVLTHRRRWPDFLKAWSSHGWKRISLVKG